MAQHTVLFTPLERKVTVDAGTTLLEAAGRARITIDSVCGGDGICGRCKMIVRKGKVGGDAVALLTREEIREGVVLACQTTVQSDLVIEIPEATRAREKIVIDQDAQRFRAVHPGTKKREFVSSPIVTKVALRIDPPSLENSLADCQRVQAAIEKQTGISSMQAGLKIIRRMPQILRENDFTVTAIVGRRAGVAELMDVEGGNTSDRNVMAVVDVGTSTVVAHLVEAVTMTTIGAAACFNSQATYGREVTSRMIAAEKRGPEPLQRLLVEDINQLLSSLATEHAVSLRDINAVICAGNTTMMHFLLALPTRNIRRYPYVAATTQPPPFRAAEVGIKINPRGLLFAVPCIGGWVGGDLAAGILATGLHEMDGVGMLIDVGTNGEIIVGNKDWLIACSASAGPALEGAGVECGMMAHKGAVERVRLDGQTIRYDVIGGGAPDGICGSGIIDLIAVLLERGTIDRSGRIIPDSDPRVRPEGGRAKFVLAGRGQTLKGNEVSISQHDIDSVITAKAAIFAAAKIMLDRLDLRFCDIDRLMIAGGFGNYIDLKNAVAIGLLPDVSPGESLYVGNTSIWGAKLAAFSGEARQMLGEIVQRTTYFDLMGTDDYVDQFKQAMFLPHTNIELFPSAVGGRGERKEGG
ncbi:MAG TPA: ASKHA domain-containing protein [Phycisphaerae bacterium]|nr:ASKHA domain-containing protein [Phycisphaerae bacterium]